MRTVYLAGPIIGHTESAANDWRRAVSRRLERRGIRGISPLRCEPPSSLGTYTSQYGDQKFGTARAISSKNVFDVRSCDMVLIYVPAKLLVVNPAYGSIVELGWAHILGKPAVLVSDDPYIREHPLINACAGWMLDTLDEGIEVITGLLGDYAEAPSLASLARSE